MKKCVSEKKMIFNFSKNVMSFEKRKFFVHGNFFEQNYFFSSQWIKSQKMVRIMKKDACEIYFKIEAKKMSEIIIRPLFRNVNQ